MNPFVERRFKLPNADMRELCQAMLENANVQEFESFLQDLCTHQELRTLSERWVIAKLAHMGFPYRVISQKTGAGTSTIARMTQSLTYGSGQLLRACRSREKQMEKQFRK